jgi:hypothetical protein
MKNVPVVAWAHRAIDIGEQNGLALAVFLKLRSAAKKNGSADGRDMCASLLGDSKLALLQS